MLHLQSGHQLQLLQGGQAFFQALIGAIDRSVHEVRFETYIFSVEACGEQVAAAVGHRERLARADADRQCAMRRFLDDGHL